MKKSSQKKQRVNWKVYSDLAALEYLQENLGSPPIQARVMNLLLWHGKHADACKFNYYSFQIGSMILSAVITLINVVMIPSKEQIITACSVAITLFTGISMLMKYQENWLRYRKCYEQIKSQCFLYLEGSGPYKDLEPSLKDQAFCEYLETQAIQINEEWFSSEKKQGAPQEYEEDSDEETL